MPRENPSSIDVQLKECSKMLSFYHGLIETLQYPKDKNKSHEIIKQKLKTETIADLIIQYSLDSHMTNILPRYENSVETMLYSISHILADGTRIKIPMSFSYYNLTLNFVMYDITLFMYDSYFDYFEYLQGTYSKNIEVALQNLETRYNHLKLLQSESSNIPIPNTELTKQANNIYDAYKKILTIIKQMIDNTDELELMKKNAEKAYSNISKNPSKRYHPSFPVNVKKLRQGVYRYHEESNKNINVLIQELKYMHEKFDIMYNEAMEKVLMLLNSSFKPNKK